MKPLSEGVIVALSLLWLGMIIGVSFIATPVKFTAQSLALPVALDVGRVTFALFSRIEWAACLVLLAATSTAVWTGGRGAAALAMVATLAFILAVQALWLLPALDERVAAIIAGTPPPPSLHHTAYAIGEAAKAILLASVALVAVSRLAQGDQP